ncbi:hypothetical protein [Rugamonas sp.]|uniref:hypothetical protein n=1 Tax=Rugamonas sp. TaxID=1926287 RepID=UPI0025FC3888|nr:hypothetical protein [Rugamonas sp.]
MQAMPTMSGGYPPATTAAAGDTAAAFDGHNSGVSWGAVFAGAATAAALSFVLLILGFGLGLSAVSPWSYSDAPVARSTILWITFMELASAGIGGYIAGRLRVKWASVHTDEVYFRDTAHGLLAWAVATLLMAALMAGATKSAIGGAVNAAAAAGGAATAAAVPMAAAATSDRGGSGSAYFTDMLMRSDSAAPETDNGAARAEVGRIFATDLRAGALAPDDRQYLAGMVAKRTGMSQPDAERRVDDVYARLSKATADAKAAAKNYADQARKAAAASALWMFVALLIGAFVASICATLGGRRRDSAILVHRA